MKHQRRILQIFIFFLALPSIVHAADWKFQSIDTFDEANNLADYGLNDHLRERSLFLYPLTPPVVWSRRAGTWYDKPFLREWFAQVNHPVHPGTLSFHNEINAVCQNVQIDPGTSGVYRIKAKVSPIVGDSAGSASANWASIMLDASPTKRGWVTETSIGFSIRSNGNFQIYQPGFGIIYSDNAPFRDTYNIVLEIEPGRIRGTVNDMPFESDLPNSIPMSAYLYLGAYLETGQVSTFDDVIIQTRSGLGRNHLKKYGYYWTEGFLDGKDHLPEVSDYTNFNFIQPGPPLAPPLSKLSLCVPKKCVLQVRWEFWSAGPLSPDWKKNWANTFEEIKKNKDKIAALYITDEPFANGVLWGDYVLVQSQVRSDLNAAGMGAIPIIAAFSAPEITNTLPTKIDVPRIDALNLNWAGFDHYPSLANFGEIRSLFAALQRRAPGRSYFLVPQTSTKLGTTTDAETAAINWAYYHFALQEPSIVALMNFGLWTDTQPAELKYTLQVQKLIGTTILEP